MRYAAPYAATPCLLIRARHYASRRRYARCRLLSPTQPYCFLLPRQIFALIFLLCCLRTRRYFVDNVFYTFTFFFAFQITFALPPDILIFALPRFATRFRLIFRHFDIFANARAARHVYAILMARASADVSLRLFFR